MTMIKYVLIISLIAALMPASIHALAQQQQQQEANPFPFFNPNNAEGLAYVCYTDGYANGKRVFFNTTAEKSCLLDNNDPTRQTSTYYVGFVHGCQASGQFQDTCVLAAKVSLESEPKAEPQPQPQPNTRQAQAQTVEVQTKNDNDNGNDNKDDNDNGNDNKKLECQPEDEFCTEGCEREDMICSYGEPEQEAYRDEIPIPVNDPCNYHGLNVCNTSGECDNDRFDCASDDCINGRSGTTGQCEGDDGPYGSNEVYDYEGACDENDDYCDQSEGCGRSDIDCIDDVNEGDDGEDSDDGGSSGNDNGEEGDEGDSDEGSEGEADSGPPSDGGDEEQGGNN